MVHTDTPSTDAEVVARDGEPTTMAVSYIVASHKSTTLYRLLSPLTLDFDNCNRTVTSLPMMLLKTVDGALTEESCQQVNQRMNR